MITKYNILAGLALTLAGLTACGKSDKSAAADKMSPDTSLASDLAAASGTQPQPALADTGTAATTPPPPAAATADTAKPVTKAEPVKHHKKSEKSSGGNGTGNGASAPAGPTVTASGNTVTTGGNGGGKVGTVAAGTNIALTSNQRICTDSNKAGDPFSATVVNPVVGSNGAVIPAGSTVSGHVVALGGSKAVGQTVTFTLAFDNLSVNGTGYPLDASMAGTPQLTQHRTTGAGTDAAKVGGGAVAGAVIGALIGHSVKGAVIGGAAGAAAGGGVAVATGSFAACLPSGGKLTIQLNSDQQIRM